MRLDCAKQNLVTVANSQAHKWVRPEGSTVVFRADKSFRGVKRFDCIRLKQRVTVSTCAVLFAQLLCIVTVDHRGLELCLCVAVPLRNVQRFLPKTQAQAELTSAFDIVEPFDCKVFVFPCSLLDRIEQIQFGCSGFALVNNFYHSKLFSSCIEDDDE